MLISSPWQRRRVAVEPFLSLTVKNSLLGPGFPTDARLHPATAIEARRNKHTANRIGVRLADSQDVFQKERQDKDHQGEHDHPTLQADDVVPITFVAKITLMSAAARPTASSGRHSPPA
jgi:hypothetical protein